MNRLIALGAAGYAGLGIVSFLKPSVVPATTGLTAPNADSRTEIRAVYGGLPLGLAATLVANPASASAVGIATAGMALGRAASSVFEGRPSPTMAGFTALEAVAAAALLLGARRHAR
ncbi:MULTISPECIES: DUF4345 family protein [unclassified Nocardioides]|uniref:DUF4345 family protein n=1 Tax=unclassified Nocardioides TaxID=2615069 RepID=UPI0006FD3768|nr:MULTISPECIES: DUF4345 family protein [unclassified Nocardioides]KRA31437.1 hypothetical protein ASD81_18560 [Nocardioides sp. Root614]KRA88057.1 hypothetical protein ASD84_18835 [Nocardioides sp. Root682]